MEHSLTSYKQNRPAICEPEEEEEESGWTAYFEDFSNQQHQEHSSCSSLGTSMVSDAASCAAWRLSHQIRPNFPTKLRFKKTRTKEISQDDSLEDTASSPVNSPKVSDMKPMDMSLRTTEDHHHHHHSSSLRKGYISEGYTRADQADALTRQQQQQPQQQHMNFCMNNDCTDEDHLKKRGLCLVPMSMLVNYFG